MQLIPFDRCDNLRLTAEVSRNGNRLEFVYEVSGETADVVLPPHAPRERTDGLWQATCFEAFISMGKTGYAELNFAPSGAWAAYRFGDYRQDMREQEMPPPSISFAGNRLTAEVELDIPPGAPLNLTAVIEHNSGSRSYWALAHPNSNRPDFHARDCFVASLP